MENKFSLMILIKNIKIMYCKSCGKECLAEAVASVYFSHKDHKDNG
jgi:hypothetical protein